MNCELMGHKGDDHPAEVCHPCYETLLRERDEAIQHRDDYETRVIEQSIKIRSLQKELQGLRDLLTASQREVERLTNLLGRPAIYFVEGEEPLR